MKPLLLVLLVLAVGVAAPPAVVADACQPPLYIGDCGWGSEVFVCGHRVVNACIWGP